MPNAYLQGIQKDIDLQAQVRNDVSVVSTNWFVNRCPLVTRVPRVPVSSTVFSVVSRSPRNRLATLSAAALAADTLLTFQDASALMVGDVLELPSGERVEITADPNPSTNAVQVRRGAEGTTPAAAANGGVVRLIGNSRSGAEVDQKGIALASKGTVQYCQTWQHPVQVGGSLQGASGFVGYGLGQTPFEQNKMDALQNLMDDMEVSSYYGLGEDPSVGGRPKQKGLRSQIVSNRTTAPLNATAYKPTDLIRDTLEKCRTNGGNPDVLVVSTNFMSGLATWGHAAQRVDAGTNVFGVPIEVFEAPFLGGIALIEAPLLKPFTAICLSSASVRLRMKRNEFWNNRGNRGDAYEGDWIAEGAIELENEQFHAWVEGIQGFSAN